MNIIPDSEANGRTKVSTLIDNQRYGPKTLIDKVPCIEISSCSPSCCSIALFPKIIL